MEQRGVVPEGARDADLRRVLAEAVARMGKPSSATELRRALPKPYQRPAAEIAGLLEELAAARRVFQVAASSKARKYTHRNPEELVQRAILEALREGPLTKKQLADRIKRAAPGLDKIVPSSLAALQARGVVHEHPKVGKLQAKLALSPPDPTPFLASAIREMKAAAKKLAPHGVSLPAIYAALGRALGVAGVPPVELGSAGQGSAAPRVDPEEADDAAVLAAVRELAAREPPGALLKIRALRAAQRLDKGRFDRAVLRLAEAGKVILHHHDFAASLPPAERAELVQDDHGIDYVGIALKRGQ